MIGIAINLFFFIFGFYIAQSMEMLIDAGAYIDAAVHFAMHFGISAAVGALIRNGNWGLGLGFLIGALQWTT